MDHFCVTVSRNGEEIVTIETNCLAGREISAEDEKTIRTAALHLLAFIGEPARFESALNSVRVAAEALWHAHCRTNDEKAWPVKYSMNYGELMELRRALDAADATDISTR